MLLAYRKTGTTIKLAIFYICLSFVMTIGLSTQALSDTLDSDISAASQRFPKKGLVVLIPGTGNSAVPGETPTDNSFVKTTGLRGTYFGKIPVREIESQGYHVFIPTELRPLGDIAENGNRTFKSLKKFYQERYPEGSMPIYILGHSAGGLYGLRVLELNKTLPIKKLVMLSTPLQGNPFSELLFGRCPLLFGCNLIHRTIQKVAAELGLNGLIQLREKDVRYFIRNLRIPNDVEISTVGGSQLSNSRARSNDFCLLCVSADLLFSGDSDGVIGNKSAYGASTRLRDLNGEFVNINPLYELHIPLGHHEQVVSAGMLRLMGQRNIRYVKAQQKRFYKNLGLYFSE